MRESNLFQMKNKLVLVIMVFSFISLLNSCNTQGKQNEEKSTGSVQTTSISSEKDSITQKQTVPTITGGFVKLKSPYTNFTKLYNLPSFVKFRLIPYQRNAGDHVRLYCYALNKDINDARTNDRLYRLGLPFFISENGLGEGEDPASLAHAIIHDTLALTKDDMYKILQMSPHAGMNIILEPVIGDTLKTSSYTSYKVYKDSKFTNIILNPSPPGIE